MEKSEVRVSLSATNFVIGIVVGYLANYNHASDTGNSPVLDLASTSAHRAAQHTLELLKEEETSLTPDFEIIRTPPYWSSMEWHRAVGVTFIRFGLLHKMNQYEYKVILDPSLIERYWDYLPGTCETWQAAARHYTEFLRSDHQRYRS